MIIGLLADSSHKDYFLSRSKRYLAISSLKLAIFIRVVEKAKYISFPLIDITSTSKSTSLYPSPLLGVFNSMYFPDK